jgi:hypothetical protein
MDPIRTLGSLVLPELFVPRSANVRSLYFSTALRRRRRSVPSRPFICAPVTQVTERSAGIRDNEGTAPWNTN